MTARVARGWRGGRRGGRVISAGVVAGVLGIVGGLGLASCSDDKRPAPSTTTALPNAGPLRTDLVRSAIAAVEAQLGGPQRYFEINATSLLVNLFVATKDDAVTPFLYLDGTLSNTAEVAGAAGNTFEASALTFDPATVTDQVGQRLPGSIQESFVIEGGPDGAVRYSIIVRSNVGGQLVVEVSPTGSIVSAESV